MSYDDICRYLGKLYLESLHEREELLRQLQILRQEKEDLLRLIAQKHESQ